MKVTLTLCLLFLGFTINAQETLAGIWNTGKDNTKVEFTAVDGVYSAKIVASDNAKAKIGAPLVKEVKLAGKEWKGKLYSAKKRKWYDATITKNESTLKVKVKVGMMKKTLEWTKE